MSASGRRAGSKRRQVQSARGNASGNSRNREAMPQGEAMPPQRPIKATAFNTAAIFSGIHKEEEVPRAQLCLPFKTLPNEDSDVSLQTARCITDRISQETPSDVVWKAGGGENIQNILHALQKRGAYQKASNKREEDTEEELLKGIIRASAAEKAGATGDCCPKCSMQPRPEKQQKEQQQKQQQQQQQAIDCSEQTTKIDASELLQLLIGIVYGSDNRKMRIGRRMVESSPSVSATVSNCVGLKGRGVSSGVFHLDATDQSEMMTLSCGDITQSKTILIAQLQEAANASQRSGGGSGGGGGGNGGGNGVCDSGGDGSGGGCGVRAAISTANATLAERIRRACHRSNNCSVLTFNGSEVAPATTTIASALNEEIIPPSDRAGKSPAGDAGCVSFCECDTTYCQREHVNSPHQTSQASRSQHEEASRSQNDMSRSQTDISRSQTDMSRSQTDMSRSQYSDKRQQQQHRRQQTTFGNSDVTVESRVVFELGNLEPLNGVAGGVVDYCTCNDDDNSRPVPPHRHVNRRRSRSQRFGRLRTPEICKRTPTSCSTTAAEVEWDETLQTAPSVSERHQIDSSSSESSGSKRHRKTKRRQRSAERRKSARKSGGKKSERQCKASCESQQDQKEKKPQRQRMHRNRSRDS